MAIPRHRSSHHARQVPVWRKRSRLRDRRARGGERATNNLRGGHYLSFAPLDAEVIVKVDLAVVGRRVTQARAIATESDREVLTVNAALGTGDLTAPTPWLTFPDVPPPEECRQRVNPRHVHSSIFDHLETRIANGRGFESLDGTPGSPVSALWARVPNHLDPSAASLALFGDLVAGGSCQPLGRNTMGRSLDNTIRVATLVPTEWILIETTCTRSPAVSLKAPAIYGARTERCSAPPVSPCLQSIGTRHPRRTR